MMTDYGKEVQGLKDALSKANNEVEKLSRIKADFISVISHELRTPLTSIKESISLVLDGIAGPLNEEQKKFLTIAKNNIDRLAKLIIDILDLSKLESGRITMRKRKLNINELIKEVYASTKASAEQKNMEFSISLGESVEPTWFDPDRIGQVLRNLISNAIKFNKDNGKIKISSLKENINDRDFIRIIVEDNGIGIPPQDTENLFRNFSSLDASMTRKYGGAGLGLAISKGIIELHGGDIWVISEPDAGSKFIFTMPIYKKHEEFDFLLEEAIERSRHNDIKIALIVFKIKDAKDRIENVIAEVENTMKNTVRGPEDKIIRCKKGECVIIAGTDRPGAMAIIKRLKDAIKVPLLFGVSVHPTEAIDKEELIKKAEEDLESGRNSMVPQKILLIIDDEEALASMLSFRLKSLGFNTIAASDGEEGIELAKKNKPDLILLDLMMPKVDGFEVSKRLKKDPDTRHIPIVVFSALANKNTKESIEQLGAAGFIEKPFEPEDLLIKIEKVLEVKNG
ncbi:MAG: ATP-binding protein [Candidatus Omnitrophica bacterium]|nr:ATP-binding protein [Candidatus Omnitrophota bacterium]